MSPHCGSISGAPIGISRGAIPIRDRNRGFGGCCGVCEVRGTRSRSSVLPDRGDCGCLVLRIVRGDERLCSNSPLGVRRDVAVAAAAAVGFKSSAWIVVAALAGHGIFDAVHGHIIENALPPLGAGLVFWCDVGTAAWLRSCTKRGGAASGRSAPSRRIRTATGDSECESRSMQLGADFVGRRVHRDDTAAVPCCRGAGGFKLRRDGTPLPDIERFNRVCGRSDLFTYGCDFDKPPAQRRLTWEAPERRR